MRVDANFICITVDGDAREVKKISMSVLVLGI